LDGPLFATPTRSLITDHFCNERAPPESPKPGSNLHSDGRRCVRPLGAARPMFGGLLGTTPKSTADDRARFRYAGPCSGSRVFLQQLLRANSCARRGAIRARFPRSMEMTMARTAAAYMADTLLKAGVRRIYGVVGDSLNGFTDALREMKSIDWIHVRHEEGAAFAAGAEAHVTDELAVCAGLRSGQPASDQWPVRLPAQRRPRARHRRAHPEQRDRHRLFPGDSSGKPVQGLQPLCRARFESPTVAADPDPRDP